MQNKQPGWDDLRVLLAVHRGGSFLAAGLELGVSTSTVARRVGALEAELGRALVHRTTQGTQVEGDILELVLLAQQFEQSLAAHRRDMRSPFAGVVRVSVPEGVAPLAAEAAVRFAREHPETAIEVSQETRFVDLVAREANIGVRSRPSTSPVLIDRPLGEVHSGLFASATYLEHRLPSRFIGAADYAGQDFIVEDASPSGRGPASWLIDCGARRFSFRSNVVDARVHAARGDLGLVILARADRDRHGDLEEVTLEAPLPTIPFFLTMHKELRRVARVRGYAAALIAVVDERALTTR